MQRCKLPAVVNVSSASGTGDGIRPPGEQGWVELDHPHGLAVSAGPTRKRVADAAAVGDKAHARDVRRRLL